MKNKLLIYEENMVLIAKYYHPKSDEYLHYNYIIQIHKSKKNPVQIILTFKGIQPYVAPMPPENYKIKASSILDLYLKLAKWLKKYGYILK